MLDRQNVFTVHQNFNFQLLLILYLSLFEFLTIRLKEGEKENITKRTYQGRR